MVKNYSSVFFLTLAFVAVIASAYFVVSKNPLFIRNLKETSQQENINQVQSDTANQSEEQNKEVLGIKEAAPDPEDGKPDIPNSILHEVPFTSQAPHANWDEPYQNLCEEAAALMAAFWVKGEEFISKTHQDLELLKIKQWEEETFGDYIDTTAEETAQILTDYFNIPKVEVLSDPQISDLQAVLAQDGVVVVPTAGKLLENPHFRGDGPLYHMLVIIGYDNDPGTKFGKNYTYSTENIDKSIANWYNPTRTVNPSDRKVIAVYK